MGRRGYPPEFRRKVLNLVASGRKVSEVAFDLEISDQTIYSWLRQDRIDRGLEPGLTTPERAELRAAKRRIAELEAELATAIPSNRRDLKLADLGLPACSRSVLMGVARSRGSRPGRRAALWAWP